MGTNDRETTASVRDFMTAFAERTGLTGEGIPMRYLWTDAFAVCNFLALERRTHDRSYGDLALRLVNQVHQVLGRHRDDDPRTGWISGLADEIGRKHPTRGGLRIGKPLNERAPSEPMDEDLEWNRDGQYFHYLTKWMHALSRAARLSGDARYIRWAIELAETAYNRFTYVPSSGGREQMHWKMSIDLSRPLVEAMGQHDPLDGLVTLMELRATAKHLREPTAIDLDPRIASLAAMCEGESLATADPLGTGGLLTAMYTLVQLQLAGTTGHEDLIATLAAAALPGLEYQAANPDLLSQPPDHRLAFRELGLSIGLRAARQTQSLFARSSEAFQAHELLRARIEALTRFVPLVETIETFWLDPANRRSGTWREHEDINAVMLATSLAPEGFLSL